MSVTSFDDVLARLTPTRRTVTICVDGSALDDYERAEDAGDEKALAAARERVEAGAVEFVVLAIGSYAWTDLVVAHAPKDGEPTFDLGAFSKSVPAGILVVGRKFVPAAIAACLESPKATEEQVAQLLDTLNQGQADVLWQAVLECNGDKGEIPKSARPSAGTKRSGAKRPTSARAASPEASSTGES